MLTVSGIARGLKERTIPGGFRRGGKNGGDNGKNGSDKGASSISRLKGTSDADNQCYATGYSELFVISLLHLR